MISQPFRHILSFAICALFVITDAQADEAKPAAPITITRSVTESQVPASEASKPPETVKSIFRDPDNKPKPIEFDPDRGKHLPSPAKADSSSSPPPMNALISPSSTPTTKPAAKKR